MFLHLITPAQWRSALDVGAVVPPSLDDVGFVHLSTPEQVQLPARRLFAGRQDVLLLVVDPARLTDPVRFEPGVPGDPGSMRFPHLHGPLPVTAVVAVLPWTAIGSGAVVQPDDPAGRHAAHLGSLAVRRALVGGEPVRETPLGIAVGSPGHPASRDDNALLVTTSATPAAVRTAATPLVAEATPAMVLLGPRSAPEIDDLAADGWTLTENRVLARPASEPVTWGGRGAGAAEVVGQSDVHPLWEAGWVKALGGASEVVAQLIDREQRNDRAVRVTDVAVREQEIVLAAGQLRIDGATACVEAVQTLPAAQGRGLADTVLARLLELAADAGCDLVVLEAVADDWPRHWYARRGFADVGAVWHAHRDSGRHDRGQ